MSKLILYHGTADEKVTPTFGKGNKHRDFGQGFYLTNDITLAKEWAVCQPKCICGFVHRYELDLQELQILDFKSKGILVWLAELMKHRDADSSRRYRMLAPRFISQFGVESSGYDVISGWRADASYFYIAKEFVRDNVDVDIPEQLLMLGNLGIQYCIKSELAYSRLHEIESELQIVPYEEFNSRYNQRDTTARQQMYELINSDANQVKQVFSTLLTEVDPNGICTSLFR